jgi:6-phosphogluconolactonase (cycloisomerase 2 family)
MRIRAFHRTFAALLWGATLCGMLAATAAARADGRDDRDDDHGNNRGGGNKSFVYVNDNLDGPNAVESFARDPNTGRLTHLGRTFTGGNGFPFTGGFEQHSLVSDGDFLYAVNPGAQTGAPSDDGTISSFRIHKDGSLELLNVVSSRGLRPVSLALHDDLLYVANQGSIPGSGEGLPGSYSGYHVRKNGSLEPIPGAVYPVPADASPADIVFSPDGSRLVASVLFDNVMDSFNVTKAGLLTNHQQAPAGGGPFGATFVPTQPDVLLVTLAVPELFGPPAPGVGSYRVNRNAHLDLIENNTVEGSRDPCWIDITRDGRLAWTDSFIPRMLILFSVGRDGRVTELSRLVGSDDPNTPPDDTQPGGKAIIGATDIALSPDNDYLYQLRAFSVPDGAVPVQPRLHVYAVTRDLHHDAGLDFVQEALLPADLSEAGVMGLVVVDRNGKSSD